MTTTITDTETTTRRATLDAAVRLLNRDGVSATTFSTIAAEAGITETELAEEFESAPEIFTGIIESLRNGHAANIDATMLRRRSLTESIQVAMSAFWGMVEARVEDHRAAQLLKVAALTNPAVLARSDIALHHLAAETTQHALLEIERIHGIRWELPVARLAQLAMATLDGLVSGYLVNRDSDGARRVLDIFSYQLAQHGRRVAKNYPY